MASEKEVFQAHITAKDEASKTVDEIGARVKRLGHEFVEAGKSAEHMHAAHAHAVAGISGHLNLLHHHFGEVRASIGETGEQVAELLPVFAAFGAVASLEGVVENIDQTAEAFSKLHHEAANAGIAMKDLQQLHFAGALSDTDPEAIDNALKKLNRTLGEVANGGGKKAAELFDQLHIAITRANGSSRSAAEVLPDLADAIKNAPGPAERTNIAATFMGKGGSELIDFLSQGGAKIKAAQADFARIGFSPNEEQQEALERYHTAMVRIQTATQAAMQAMGTAAAPALQPILDGATEFLTTHREGISEGLAADLEPIKAWIEGGGLDRAEKTMSRLAHGADAVVQAIGGWQTAFEAFGVLTLGRGLMFFAAPLNAVAALTKGTAKLASVLVAELVPAWGAVAESATAAAAAETAAAGGAMLKGLGKVFIGGAVADWLDRHDDTGRWMDKHVPGAALLDNFAYEHTGGAFGRPTGWADKPDKPESDEAGGGETKHADAALVEAPHYLPPTDNFSSWKDREAGLPGLYDQRSLPSNDREAGLPGIYDQPPLPTYGRPINDSPQGFVKVQIDVSGLPAGATVRSTGEGAAAQPKVNLNSVGQFWMNSF